MYEILRHENDLYHQGFTFVGDRSRPRAGSNQPIPRKVRAFSAHKVSVSDWPRSHVLTTMHECFFLPRLWRHMPVPAKGR
jgi:hypothetical protein